MCSLVAHPNREQACYACDIASQCLLCFRSHGCGSTAGRVLLRSFGRILSIVLVFRPRVIILRRKKPPNFKNRRQTFFALSECLSDFDRFQSQSRQNEKTLQFWIAVGAEKRQSTKFPAKSAAKPDFIYEALTAVLVSSTLCTTFVRRSEG